MEALLNLNHMNPGVQALEVAPKEQVTTGYQGTALTPQVANALREAAQALTHITHDVNSTGAWTSFLIYTLQHHMRSASTPALRELLERSIEAEVFRICMAVLQNVHADRTAILETMMAASDAACHLSNSSFNPFARLFEFRQFNTLVKPTGTGTAAAHKTVAGNVARVVWVGRGKLEELVHQLLGQKLITSKSAFFDLFSSTRYGQVRICWDLSRKAHLAHLWHGLYVKGLIQAVASKGYFAFAEAHFTGMHGEVLRRNSLKRISSVISTEPDRFPSVIKDVERILSNVIG
jgi:hypothetical protein